MGVMRYERALLAAVLIGGVGLAGCKINPKEVEYYPKMAGNTFDLQNDLGVTLPTAERINISYEYVPVSDDKDGDYVEAEDIYEGELWWFEERTAADPEQFVGIHLLTRDEGYDEPPGQLVKLSRTGYTAQTYCFDLTQDEIPPEIAPIVESLLDLGHSLSTDLYVRRYVLRDEREGRERTDVIYARDVVRLGYTCEAIGDLVTPGVGTQEIVDKLQSDAQAAFEVMT